MDLCSLLDFYCSVRAILPPLFYPTLSVTRTKEFCRNLELFKSWKKPGFFHKWLYRVEKTNTSIHCRSHKTSESAAVSSLHESTITPTDSIWNTINVKVHCNTDTRVCRHPCTCGTKNIIHIILKEEFGYHGDTSSTLLWNAQLRMTCPYGESTTEGKNRCFDERAVNRKSIRAAGVMNVYQMTLQIQIDR